MARKFEKFTEEIWEECEKAGGRMKHIIMLILVAWLIQIIGIIIMIDKPYEPMPEQIGLTQSF